MLEAAVTLFVERGYAEVTLADVAAEVGLARNSLYRYVPDKSHLLVQWYRQVVPRTIAQWNEAVAGDDPAALRLMRWARTYLAWARSPEHQLVGPLTEALPSLGEPTRTEVTTLHRSMIDVVSRVVSDAGVPPGQVASTVHLLSGLVLGAARAEQIDGEEPALLHRLDAAVEAIVSPAPAEPNA